MNKVRSSNTLEKFENLKVALRSAPLAFCRLCNWICEWVCEWVNGLYEKRKKFCELSIQYGADLWPVYRPYTGSFAD